MNKFNFIFAACILTFICPLAVSADIPMMLNYQGYVEDSGGTPIEGSAFLKFAIVNQAGDMTYWSNDGTSVAGDEPDNAVALIAANGIFSIKLGNQDLTNMAALPTTPFDNQDIYIRVWFSEDNITFEQLAPDTQIVSGGFAYMAQSVVNGITTETDPTITEVSIKDGVDWSELTGIPTDFADGVDNTGSGSESDPVFLASAAAGITSTNITNWNTAHGWGNHDSQGYLTNGTGITTVYSGEGTKGYANSGPVTIEFDCSEVAGTGIDCNGEDINVYSLRGYNLGVEDALFAANDGTIGIGNTSPDASYKLDVNGSAHFNTGGGNIAITTPGSYTGILGISSDGDRRDIQFRDNPGAITILSNSDDSIPDSSDGIWIMENGYVGIGGQGSSSNQLTVASGGSSYQLYVSGTAYCTGTWSASDIRWKKNIEPLQNTLEKVSRLQGVSYEWKLDEFPNQGFKKGIQIGLVAQDVEEVMPELVHTNDNGFKAVSYDKLTAMLIEAVKKQQETINQLNARLDEMGNAKQAELASLRDQIAHLHAMVETFIAQQTKSEDSKSLLTLSKASGSFTPEKYLNN